MREAGGLAGGGEGEREGTLFQQKLSSNKIKTYSVLKQHNVGFSNKIKTVFKTVFCR